MSGHTQIDGLFRDPAIPVTDWRRLLLPGAVLSFLAAWYFALIIAAPALGTSAPTVQQGLLPERLGCREILHGRNPYRPEVTQQIELAIYGEPVSAASPVNQHRFAYPVFFVFLFLPQALLPFDTAQWLMLAACVADVQCPRSAGGRTGHGSARPMSSVSRYWRWQTYPAVVALQLRQPTLIVAALLAFSFFWCDPADWSWQELPPPWQLPSRSWRLRSCFPYRSGRSPRGEPGSHFSWRSPLPFSSWCSLRSWGSRLDHSLAGHPARVFALRGSQASAGRYDSWPLLSPRSSSALSGGCLGQRRVLQLGLAVRRQLLRGRFSIAVSLPAL